MGKVGCVKVSIGAFFEFKIEEEEEEEGGEVRLVWFCFSASLIVISLLLQFFV